MRRVVVTGMGAVCSVGNDVEQIWKSLLAGRSGITAVDRFDVSELRCRICGFVKNLNLDSYLDVKEQKRLDPFCHFAVVAGDEAMKSAGLLGADFDSTRFGVLVSSGIGGMHSLQEQTKVAFERGLNRVSPLLIPLMLTDMASGFLAIRYNLQGPNFSITSACASALHSIGEGSWIIKRGDADIMLVGGAEGIDVPIGFAGFSNMRALSERNDAPQEASRPFDKDRDGFVPSEGSGILVLEEEEHALRRGANIMAEVVGYGLTADAHHITAPREDAASTSRAIVNALKGAEMPSEAISYINAHGTSTQLNDKAETLAIKQALGEHARHVAISSTKSMTGHSLGASGGLESVFCVKAILDGVVPPTINQCTPDPDCDLDYVPNVARELDVNVALNLSFGFGGHNAAVLFKKYTR